MVTKTNKYTEATGKRKSAVARVRITPTTKNSIEVNGRALAEYFTVPTHQNLIQSVLDRGDDKFDVTVIVSGGGVAGQADAVRHGLAKALISLDPQKRQSFKKDGLITRDARIKERRKFGLKKARKSPQWSKR